MKMCQAFAKNGHEVILLAPDKTKHYEFLESDIWQFYDIHEHFSLNKLPWLYWLKGKSYLYGFMAGLKARLDKPDLVYSRNIFGAYFAAMFNLPVIFESHAPVEQAGKVQAYIFLRLLQSSHFKRLVVITSSLRQHYRKNYPSIAEKIIVAPDGADPLPDDLLPALPPAVPARMRIGYVGHLYKGKGMEVVDRLTYECPWADFHVVGGTEADIQKWKNVAGDKHNIIFHGYVPHSSVGKYLISFDVLLLPNQEQVFVHGGSGQDIGSWTSPLKAFEYMAAKKPIVASDLPVLHEILQDGENALLCPPHSTQAWKGAFRRLDQDKALAVRLASVAHKNFLENYTWQARAREVIRGAA